MKDNKDNWPVIIFTNISISLITYLVFGILCKPDNTDKPKIKPSERLTFEKQLLYAANYEMYVDSLQYCKKSERVRLTDSAFKYRNLLTK